MTLRRRTITAAARFVTTDMLQAVRRGEATPSCASWLAHDHCPEDGKELR